MLRDLLTSLFYPPYTRWGATGAESERAGSSTSRAESCRVSIRCGHNNDPPVRRDGRWLMTRLNPRRRNTHHPANKRVPRLFLPPSWYRVVSHGVSGLQDEILSTDHDVSRHSFAYPSLSLSLSLTLFLQLLLPRPYDRFSASGWSSPCLPPVSFSHALWSIAQSPISNDYATVASGWSDSDAREKPIGAIERIGSRRCKDRSFPLSHPLFYRSIYLLDD